MALSDALLPEFDQEMANTRKTLERVPDGKFDWKPHEKSGTMGWVAGHLESIPEWMSDIIEKDSLDMAPNGVPMQPPPPPKSRKELLELFDEHVAKARKALAGASASQLLKSWSFLNNGQLRFSMPRLACLRWAGWEWRQRMRIKRKRGPRRAVPYGNIR